MSMKRILGMMLASRMAGRGARRGLGGGGLTGLAAAGMIGGRRGGLGRKAGIATLGYMAYRAYRDRQETPASRGAVSGESGDGLGGMLRSIGDAFRGSTDEPPAREGAGIPAASRDASETPFGPEHERAAEAFSEDTALLLIRAMVAAANADGVISPEERARIKTLTDDSDATAEDRRVIEHELANPRPLEELLQQVKDQETAEEFYLASRLAVDAETEASRAYLVRLRERLGLGEQEAAEIDDLAT
ncbi:MAG: tellurite resistance TerB family protein [Pararhodobacter sp.]